MESYRKRVYLTFFLFCLSFLIIIAKAFFIQVINQKKLLSYSKDQLIQESTIFPNRGNIYDRKGAPLAINVQRYSIFSIPKLIDDKNETFKKLASIIPRLSVRRLKKILSKRNRFTWLERQIELNQEQIDKIIELKGFFLEKTTKRFYPNHNLMAQVLGFVGVDNVGLSGVEYQFNDFLKGDVRVLRYLKDAKGRPIKFESYDMENKPRGLYLTLDKDIQAVAEKYLKQAVEKHKGVRGGIGVMDAQNGEIIAMANYPTFDPNVLVRADQPHRRLSFITDPFEPGSVFKIFTIASALEHKTATTKTSYFTEGGKLKLGNHIIKEASTFKKREWVSVSDIIKYSSNIGTIKIALDLTYPLLNKTIRKFGFGKKTRVQLPGESRGIYSNSDKISDLRLGNLSFGQGLAATGIQMLSAYAAIANGGVYYSPSIIKRGEGVEEGKKVLSSNIATDLQNMLLSVVEGGTGKGAQIPYFKIAGKTGTAQKVDSKGVYSGYIPNFVAFPINVEKKFVVYAYIEEPGGEFYSGGKVVVPLVKKVIEHMLVRNKEYQNLSIQAEDIAPLAKSVRERALNREKRDYKKGFMPSFIGLDKKSSKDISKKIGVRLKHRGMGLVSKQSIPEGKEFSRDVLVILDYTLPLYE